MAFTIVQIAYWLALATWFGAVLFVVISPFVILRSVRESNPLLPSVLSVNLEGQHSTLLAGKIIGDIMRPILTIELVCASVLLVAIVFQWVILHPSGTRIVEPALRSGLFVAAAGFLIYDWRLVWPRIWKHRQEYVDNADNPEVANPALDQFDKYQVEHWGILRNMCFLLLGIIIFSANIARPGEIISADVLSHAKSAK